MHSYEFQVKPKTGVGEKNQCEAFIRIIRCKLFPAPLSKLNPKQLIPSEVMQLVDQSFLLVLMAGQDPSYSTNPQTQNV